MPSHVTYYSALALTTIFLFAAVSRSSCLTLTKSESESETDTETGTETEFESGSEAATVTDGSESTRRNEDLNLCYGPPLTTGRICESRKALLNFARVSYRVTPLKNSNANSNSVVAHPDESEEIASIIGESENSANNVCCEGRGTAKGQELWVPLGCGHSPFSRTTYFDGLISFPAIRCSGSPNGVFVTWSY